MRTILTVGPNDTDVYIYRQCDDGSVHIAHNVTFEWFPTLEGAHNTPSFTLERGKKK